MNKAKKLKGLTCFNVGLILLAASGFISLLRLEEMMSAIFIAINALALLLMVAGLAKSTKATGEFRGAFTVLLIDLIITLLLVAIALTNLDMVKIGYEEYIAQVDFYASTLTKVLDIVGVFLVLGGCKHILEKMENDEQRAKCAHLQIIYLIFMLVILGALGTVVVLTPGEYLIAVYGVSLLAVLAAVFNFLAVLKISKTQSLWKRES